jgi:hypothetical protein
MKNAPTVVVYDLDSTVCDTRHRHHLIPDVNPASTWEKYSLACRGDEPIDGTIARMRLDWPYHEVHIVTGRSAVARNATEAWLTAYAGEESHQYWDQLHMRPTGTRTRNGLFKVSYIKDLQGQGKHVALAYEDYKQAAEEITAVTGVPVLGINPFYAADVRGIIK